MVLAGRDGELQNMHITSRNNHAQSLAAWSDVERLVAWARMVAGGLLLALRPGRSVYRVSGGLRAAWDECLHKCLPDRIMAPGISAL